jgi:hypothetical protein
MTLVLVPRCGAALAVPFRIMSTDRNSWYRWHV